MLPVNQSQASKPKVAVICPNCGKEAGFNDPGSFEKTEAIVSCSSCAFREKRLVVWPRDGFYKVGVCGDVLWGWSRGHFISVRDFILSKDRKIQDPFGAYHRIPARFLN